MKNVQEFREIPGKQSHIRLVRKGIGVWGSFMVSGGTTKLSHHPCKSFDVQNSSMTDGETEAGVH